MTARTLLAALLMAASAQASAQVYRCTDASGATRYQAQPCPEQGEAMEPGRLSVTPSQPVPAPATPPAPGAHERADAAGNRVQQLRNENADPERCAQARGDLTRLESRGANMQGVDAFEVRSRIMLYCETL